MPTGATRQRDWKGQGFEGASLAEVLAKACVGRLVVAGPETDARTRPVIHGAFTCEVALARGAHPTSDQSGWLRSEQVTARANQNWCHQIAPVAMQSAGQGQNSPSDPASLVSGGANSRWGEKCEPMGVPRAVSLGFVNRELRDRVAVERELR